MAWVRFDDSYDEHPKVMRVGHEAAWLNVRAIMWCNRNETDGHVPEIALRKFGDDYTTRKRNQLVERLVEHGLWEVDGDGDGWWLHDYLVYQPSREDRAAEREAARQRMARAREAKASKAAARSAEQAAAFARSSPEHPQGVRPKFGQPVPAVPSVPSPPSVPTEPVHPNGNGGGRDPTAEQLWAETLTRVPTRMRDELRVNDRPIVDVIAEALTAGMTPKQLRDVLWDRELETAQNLTVVVVNRYRDALRQHREKVRT